MPEDKNYSSWVNPEGVEDTSSNPEVVAREEFVKTKTEDEWTSEAQAAEMEVQEYLNQQFAANSGAGDDGKGGAGGQDSTQFTPNALWDELKGVDGFTLPDNLSSENEAELLKEALIKNGMAKAGDEQQQQQQQQQTPEITDPDILAFMRFKELNPQATINDYVNERTQYSDMLNLDDREFMVAHLQAEYGIYDEQKNPDGLTQDQIDETVDAMDQNKTLILEARKLKRGYREKSSSVENITDEQIAAKKAQAREEMSETIKSDAQKLFAETEKITELNGVKLGKAEITEINTAFQDAILPNKEGSIPIMEMLQSDRVLWNFFAVNYLGDDKFKTALFNAGDATKEDLYTRLGLKPINTGGRQSDTGDKKGAITPGNWSRPDPDDS